MAPGGGGQTWEAKGLWRLRAPMHGEVSVMPSSCRSIKKNAVCGRGRGEGEIGTHDTTKAMEITQGYTGKRVESDLTSNVI